MSAECGVYAIVNLVNDWWYIGQTGDPFASRWREHAGKLRRGNHQNKQLQADWNAYGSEAFEFRILEVVDIYSEDGCLRTAEHRHIKAATVPLYNILKPTRIWDLVRYVPPKRP